MLKITKNAEGCIILSFDDTKAEVLEIEIQADQCVAKRGEKRAMSSLKEEPIKLQSSKTMETYFVKKEQNTISLFNDDGLNVIIR